MNQMFFYHGYDPMQILEVIPVVGFVVNYLHPLLLVSGFLLSKALIGWPIENFRKKKLKFCLIRN